MATYKLEIVTPDGLVFDGDVEHVRAPGILGSFGVLAGHTPFITPLDIGVISVRVKGGEEKVFATSGGLADVQPSQMMILAETAESAENVDLERAKAAEERARKRLAELNQEIDLARARASLRRAENRLRISMKR